MILPLSDERWHDLSCRAGNGNKVANKLQEMLTTPENLALLEELADLISTEGTTWPAGYAAAPYIVKLAHQLPAEQRKEHAFLLGMLTTYSGSHSLEECPATCPTDLFKSYRASLLEGRIMLLHVLKQDHSPEETRWLLGVLFGLMGQAITGDLVMTLDSGCPYCGEPLLEEKIHG